MTKEEFYITVFIIYSQIALHCYWYVTNYLGKKELCTHPRPLWYWGAPGAKSLEDIYK